ncbi:MAG: ATP-binding protein [Gemmataceae bacterium]
MHRLSDPRRTWHSYLVAVLAVAIAALFRYLFWTPLGEQTPFFPFVLAVLISAWYGGLGPGLLATIVGAIIGSSMATPPLFRHPNGHFVIAIYCVIGVTASYLSGALHAAYRRAQSKQQELESAEARLQSVVTRLRFLTDAGASLATVSDYESTLQKIAGSAVPQFADWCAVDMVERGGAIKRVAVVHTDPAKVAIACQLQEKYPPAADAPHGLPKVLRTGEADMLAEITDAMIDQGAKDTEHRRLLQTLALKSYMCVPLRGRGEVIGVITFVWAESGGRYSSEDLVFAQELANRASIAIENARLYAEMREADRLKDEFLAMLAHELRNPLAPVRNALHLMRQPSVSTTAGNQVWEMAERQVQQMARLLDDLLDVSRISRGRIELRKEVIDAAVIVRRTVEATRTVIENFQHDFQVEIRDEPLPVEADPARLEQILTNLLNNAAKYTEPGGRILLRAFREDDWVIFKVKDSGVGIEPETLPRIFDLFVQGDRRTQHPRGGVGIGLTLVKRLVDLHGGQVSAASEGVGKGSEFVVRLPLARQWVPPSTSPEQKVSEGPLRKRRILVVDDNHDAADSLAQLLLLSDQDVKTAYGGEEALALAKQFQPEVVFLDIGMPRVDGFEVARRIRSHDELRGAILVALTGWGRTEDQQRTREAGFDRHLVKPVEPSLLQRLLRETP